MNPRFANVERFADVHRALVNFRGRYDVELRSRRDVSVAVNGIQLASAYNRAAEARLQIRAIAEDAPRVTVYGVGLGDVPAALLEREALCELRVVVLSVPELLGLLEHGNAEWLADPRVELRLARDVPPVIEKPFAALPPAIRLADRDAVPLRDALILELSADHQKAYFEALDAPLRARIDENRERIRHDGTVASLFGAAGARSRAVVAAGGPSLLKTLPWLSRVRDDVFLVAVSTALRPLEAAGIVPDVVCMIDPKPELMRHVSVLDDLERYREVPLAYLPLVDPDVLDAWPGPRLSFYSSHARFDAIKRELSRPTLFVSGTVTHPATDLAVRSGAKEVVLLGTDFGFPNGRTHASGAAYERKLGEHEGRLFTVVDGHGDTIRSDVSLIGFLRDLEAFIANSPHTRFFVGSRDGACIAGAPWLAEVLDD